MSLLANLTSDDSIATERDTLGGSRVLESGLYTFKIIYAYIIKATSEALGLNLTLKNADGQEIRTTIYMTSGKEKGCKNYYETKDGKKEYLPGFLLANSIALLTVGKEISELDTEEKTIKAYSYESKAEVPTKVNMVMDLLDKEITAAVVKQVVDKTKKNDATRVYEPTGETREENEIEKFFRASDKMTTAEIRAQVPEAAFHVQWAEKWAGKVKDKTKKTGAGAGTAGVPKAAQGAAAAPRKSLFGG